MRHRILIAALLVPALMVASAGPAGALFDVSGAIQRAQMIVNQAAQIANQVRQMRTMTRQLTELESQLDHMREVARGEIDALAQPFTELAAGPVGLVSHGLGWGGEFTGPAGELVQAVRGMGGGGSLTEVWRSALGAADLVSEADVLELFRGRPAEVSSRAALEYRRSREAADRQRVLDYAMMDAAASLASTVESAQDSFDDLSANGNLPRAHLSRCVYWLIGSRVSDMPPELPQTCRCLQQPPSAGLVALQRPERAPRDRPPTLATADRILAFVSDYNGTQGPNDTGIHD